MRRTGDDTPAAVGYRVVMPSFVRTVCALLVAAAVYRWWPHALNATFPCVELGRGRTPEWEPAWWAALLAVVGVALRRPFARSPVGWLERLVATACCAALVAWVVLPAKVNIDTLAPARDGLSAMPILGGGERVWTRSTAEGNAFGLAQAEMVKEAALMLLAGGIHEVAEGASGVRTALWAGMRGAANVAIGGRLVAVGLVGWVTVWTWAPWAEPRAVRRVVDGALRGLAWLLPVVNLGGLAIAAVTGLPDDADLRGRFALTWLGLGAAVAAAHALGKVGWARTPGAEGAT